MFRKIQNIARRFHTVTGCTLYLRGIVLLFMFIFALNSQFVFAQTEFVKGFNAGYKEGYCHDRGIGCIPPIPPIAPLPTVYENQNSYVDGYNRGFKMGLEERKKQDNKEKNTPTTYENRQRYQTPTDYEPTPNVIYKGPLLPRQQPTSSPSYPPPQPKPLPAPIRVTKNCIREHILGLDLGIGSILPSMNLNTSAAYTTNIHYVDYSQYYDKENYREEKEDINNEAISVSPIYTLGLRYTYKPNPYFGIDFVKLNGKFGLLSSNKGSYYNIQLMTGIRANTPSFFKVMSVYSAFRLGYGFGNVTYNYSEHYTNIHKAYHYYNNYPNYEYVPTRTEILEDYNGKRKKMFNGYCLEMELGLNITRYFFVGFSYSLHTLDWGNSPYIIPDDFYLGKKNEHTIALLAGVNFGKKKEYPVTVYDKSDRLWERTYRCTKDNVFGLDFGVWFPNYNNNNSFDLAVDFGLRYTHNFDPYWGIDFIKISNFFGTYYDNWWMPITAGIRGNTPTFGDYTCMSASAALRIGYAVFRGFCIETELNWNVNPTFYIGLSYNDYLRTRHCGLKIGLNLGYI